MNYSHGNACPVCGDGTLSQNKITATFDYKEQTLNVPDYIIWECSVCEEKLVSSKDSKQNGHKIRDFYRKVDGLLVASEIKRIRIKLGRSQDELGSLLGGGLKAFARYENCDVIQTEAMDNLLRVLDEFPHAIDVIESKGLPKRKVLSTCQVYNIEQGIKLRVGAYGGK